MAVKMLPPKPSPQGPQCPSSRLGPLAVWVVVIAGLYFAQQVLIPLALSILLAFLLAPIATFLERKHFGRAGSVILVMLAALLVVSGIGYVVVQQFGDLADKLPQYKGNVERKIKDLRPSGEGRFTRASEALMDLSRQVSEPDTTSTVSATTESLQVTTSSLEADTGASVVETANESSTTATIPSSSAPGAAAGPLARPSPQPVPVQVVSGPSSPLENVGTLLGPIFNILATAGLVFVFVLFILLQREDLRDRIIRLSGQNRIKVTTEALDEAAYRVSRYLLMQLIVNVTYGIPIGLGLWLIGIPNALLWGVLATVLRFIPYIGPWLAAAFPILLSVAVFDDWKHMFMTVALYGVIELISNNVMEPMLYGHSTGISPVAIITAAVFWTWLWGAVGLLLATPITVVMVVLGRHIPQLGFLSVLLGDEPVLSPPARLYHRLLGDDLDDAMEVADASHKAGGLEKVFDEVLVPALAMAERDRHAGDLSVEKQKQIWGNMQELVDAFEDREVAAELAQQTETGAARLAAAHSHLPLHRVLCLPARDHADELAATMLARLLSARNHTVRVVSVETLASEMIAQVNEFEPDIVVISAMPPLATTHARYLVKRVKAERSDARLVVGLWYAEGEMRMAVDRLKSAGVDHIVRSLSDAIARL